MAEGSIFSWQTIRSFRSVPRPVTRLITFLSFLTVSQGFYYITVSAYLVQIGVSEESVGLILGASGASFVLSAIPLGIVSDRHGRKRVFLLGTLGLPPALLVYAFTTDVAYLLLAGIAIGLAQGAFLTTWNAMIADQTTLENRNAAFSLSFIVNLSCNGLGTTIPVLFPFIGGIVGMTAVAVHREALVFFAAFAALSPVFLGLLLRGYRETPHPSRRIFVRTPRMGLLLKFSALNSLIGLGAGVIIPLIPTWFWLRFGIPEELSGPLLGVSFMTVGFAAIWSGGLARRYGPVKAIALTQALSTVFMVSVAFAPDPMTAAGLYVVRSALMMMASPIADAYLMSIIDPETRGMASAINSIVWRLPNSASTVVGGYLLGQGQFVLPFLVGATLYITSIGGFYAAFRNVAPDRSTAASASGQYGSGQRARNGRDIG